MILLGIDPGLGTTAAVIYASENNVVLSSASWEFGPTEGSDAERTRKYCIALRALIHAEVDHDGGIDILAIEGQQTALSPPKGSGDGRTLPPAIQAAVAGQRAGNDGDRGARAERGAKNMNMVRLAALRGALQQVAMEFELRVIVVQPQEAKRALTGDAKANKRTMQECAAGFYGLAGNCGPYRNLPADHVADALGTVLAAKAKLKREEWDEQAPEDIGD